MSDITRFLAMLVGVPGRALAERWHRFQMSDAAVLVVKVTSFESAFARERWLLALRRVGADPAVKAVVFRIEGAPGGWAAVQDVRGAIAEIRRAGLPTYAFIEAAGNAGYLIASACDRVFAVPTGELNLVGTGVEMTFFGSALEQLGVRPDFEAAGAYKSFGEPFTRSFASPSNLEAVRALVDDLQAQLVDAIKTDRELDAVSVVQLMARAPLANEEAVVEGLIDQVLYEDQLEDWLEETLGTELKHVKFGEWRRRLELLDRAKRWGRSDKRIAVLHLDGNIVMDDPGSRTAVRARTVVPMLAELRKDDDVVGIVLHVNSPGGSALASDLMWREVEQTRKKKPVVACFEDVSASGGYYLSAPCNAIFAREGTLTGSIGVFGGKLVMGDGLRKVGVNSQSVLAGPNATLFSPSRPFTDAQRVRFREMLQRFYDGFVHRVATGRGTTEEEVEPHCRGRVWTGRMAKERGLVDEIGTVEDAVEHVKSLADVRHVRREDLSGQPSRGPLQALLRDAMKDAVPAIAQMELASSLATRILGDRLTEQLQLLASHEGEVMALMPWDISVE